MRHVIERAQKVALRSIPILIEGESGTGKEILARAIQRAGPRRNNPFVAVNCGAVSKHSPFNGVLELPAALSATLFRPASCQLKSAVTSI